MFAGYPERYARLTAATHVMASLQVSQTLRLLLGGEYDEGLVHMDVWAPELERLGVKSPSGNCPVCGRCSGDQKARSRLSW
jgi:hypothetical protein